MIWLVMKIYYYFRRLSLKNRIIRVRVGNAEAVLPAERVFSIQNRIKTQLRNQLSIDRLDKLLRIKYHRK